MQTPAMGASEPMFNLPRVVVLLAGVMVAMQLIQMLLPTEESLQFLLALAFIPARYSGAAAELPGGYLTAITSFVTYMLVHAGWVHLLVNLMWMAAFGSPVAQRLGDWRFLSFSALCGIAGALTHLAFHFGEMTPVVGASAAISGQMAAAMRFVFGARPRGEADLAQVPLQSLTKTLSDRRILTVLVFWWCSTPFSALASSQWPAPKAILHGRLISAASCLGFSASASSTPAAGNRFRSSPDPLFGTFRFISNF